MFKITLALATLSATPILADVPKVITDIAPIQSLVAMVMGDLGTPVLLVDGASDPHSFQLRPSQAADLQDAQAIFWVGPTMTPWLDRVVDGLADPDASVILGDVAGITERTPMFGGDAHDDTEHSDDDHGDHDHGDHDPHIWLDPENAVAIVDAVASRLSSLDAEHAEIYAANAASAKSDIVALEGELRAILALTATRPTIVFHDAYAHFAGRFELNIVAALAEGDAADPGAEQVAELRNIVATEQATCVFTEALHSDKLILTLTDGLGVPVGRLDPEGSKLTPGPDVYFDMMRKLAQAYASCGT
ncbi:MAG: zinc ABC transporter substrate-binding protein [Deltaproteobacteria bacterium]